MPLPLLVVPVLIAIVNVLGVVSTILGIIESLDALFGDGGDLADDVRYIRAEQFRQSARDLLMEIDLNHLDDIVVPDVLARVTALQAAVAGLSIPTGAGIAGDVWDHIITNQGGIGNRTARTILEQETFVNSQTFLRLAPLHVNPDFAMRLNSVVNLDFIGAFAPLAGVNVRQRGAGQSIGAYLTSVLPAWNWQQTGGIWFADAPAETLPAQVPPVYYPARVYCLPSDQAPAIPAPVDYAPSLAAIKADTVAILADTDALQLDAANLAAGVAQTLGEVQSLHPTLADILDAVANTAAADLVILREDRDLVIGPPIALGAAGSLGLVDAVGVIIGLSNIPAGIGINALDPPVRYARRLGHVALGLGAALSVPVLLEWAVTYVPVAPTRADVLVWHIPAPTTATARIVTLAP